MGIFKSIYKGILLLTNSIRDFIKDDGMIYAAATSFYFLLSFFPAVMLIVYVSVLTLGFVYKGISVQEISKELFIYIKQVLPFLQENLTHELGRIIKSSKGLGIAGLITLILSSTAVAESLIRAVRTIFNVQKVHFISTKLLTIAAIIGVGILLALFLAITSLISNLLATNLPAVYRFLTIYKNNIFFNIIIPILLIFVGYVIITYLVIPVKVGMRRIGVSGIFFTLFFMVSKILYGYYLKNITKMTIFYGSISTLVILILWVFYITTLYLISIEIVKQISGSKRKADSKD